MHNGFLLKDKNKKSFHPIFFIQQLVKTRKSS